VTLSSALLRFLSAAASLVALAALWRYRPGWPDLPGSLSAPVTTTLLQQLIVIAAWLLAALLVLLLLARSFSRARARWIPDAPGGDFAASRGYTRVRRIRPTAVLAAGAQARLVVVSPKEPGPKPSGREVAPLAPDTNAAERPLISLLGPLSIHGAKQSRRGLRARALELIAFLALRREGAQRDEILEALWPGEDPKRSRHRLYQAVRDARRLLGDAVASERDRYWLDRTRVHVDVDELDELLERTGQAGSGERINEFLEQALALFRADPLAGCDYVWLEGELRRLRVTYLDLVKRVGRARLETGNVREALEAAERGLAADALDEDLWRLALEAEGALGLREGIAERYGRLRDLLQDRLGLEPAKETRALYLRLLSQS
jgi:DNA-binding SARP family transcriptional activator